MLVASPKHAFPPFNAGVVSDLERVFSPPPHDFEQDDQSPKGPQTQSTGHASVLQEDISVACPLHACPPFDASVATDLERVFSPPPQDFEHEDQSP